MAMAPTVHRNATYCLAALPSMAVIIAVYISSAVSHDDFAVFRALPRVDTAHEAILSIDVPHVPRPPSLIQTFNDSFYHFFIRFQSRYEKAVSRVIEGIHRASRLYCFRFNRDVEVRDPPPS